MLRKGIYIRRNRVTISLFLVIIGITMILASELSRYCYTFWSSKNNSLCNYFCWFFTCLYEEAFADGKCWDDTVDLYFVYSNINIFWSYARYSILEAGYSSNGICICVLDCVYCNRAIWKNWLCWNSKI